MPDLPAVQKTHETIGSSHGLCKHRGKNREIGGQKPGLSPPKALRFVEARAGHAEMPHFGFVLMPLAAAKRQQEPKRN